MRMVRLIWLNTLRHQRVFEHSTVKWPRENLARLSKHSQKTFCRFHTREVNFPRNLQLGLDSRKHDIMGGFNAKIYRVIQIKLNVFKKMSVWSNFITTFQVQCIAVVVMKLVTIQTSYPNYRLLSSQHPMYSASLKILTQRFSGNISATNENFSISENFSIKFYTPIGNPCLQNTTKFYLKITSNSDKVTPHSARSFSDSHCIMVHIHNHPNKFSVTTNLSTDW